MGQEIAVTPLQTITAMCAIANGGKLMMPQIIHDITDSDGNVLASFPPVEIRRVVSPETAREVTKALVGVVSPRGTAALAAVNGFVPAGKTGTAEKLNPKGGYLPGKYIVSFCGFLPADNPAFVCLVMLDDAQTGPDQDYGGLVAAPVFSRIGEKAARYMNLVPQPVETAASYVANTQLGVHD
jgi:cell division protein FtsI/penicillin-binding protein 2